MYTAEKVFEVLENIGVTAEQVSQWENYFGLAIPHDKQGKKFYTDKHIKVFKTIKKDLALGYKLTDIRNKLRSSFANANLPKNIPDSKSTTNPMKANPYEIMPKESNRSDNLHLIMLVEKLIDEKNQIIADRDYLLEQIHVLEMQKHDLSNTSLEYLEQISKYANQVEALEEQLQLSVAEIPAEKFMDSWNAKAKLLKVVFNTIDVDIPKERNKSFKVTDLPKRIYCNMAVFISSFKCEDDPLWERTETYRVVYINEEELKGELDVEYFVDNVSVAKAIYAITCSRKK